MWSSFLENIRILGNHSGCHQLPERSLFYKGKQFPVCARCTGVTIGEFLALIAIILRIPISIFTSFVLLLIMGWDWLLQFIRIAKSTNGRRVITGIFGGFGLIFLYFHVICIMKNLIKQILR